MTTNNSILIADDEQVFLDTTAELLGFRGYQCDCAKDAAEAIAFLQKKRYDLLISDIKMPGKDRARNNCRNYARQSVGRSQSR